MHSLVMSKKIILDAKYRNGVRVALVDKNNNVEEIEYETSAQRIKGNIYLVYVAKIEPALQAAFVSYEDETRGFLPFLSIHPSYFSKTSKESKRYDSRFSTLSLPVSTQEDLQNKSHDVSSIEMIEVSDEAIDAVSEGHDNIGKSTQESHKKTFHDFYKNYKIQDSIKKGDAIIAQASKDTRGGKSAAFTTYISLAGKYCVLMPNTPDQNGISRKISNSEERKRIKEIISRIVPQENAKVSSVIVRTAGLKHTEQELLEDYRYLVSTWNTIVSKASGAHKPTKLHQENEIVSKSVRDMLDHNVSEMLIQGEEAHKKAYDFATKMFPTELHKIKLYSGLAPIFSVFGLEQQIMSLYQPVVHLESGGYLVINPTEALTAIDVNSGKAVAEHDVEDMALKINLEAAKELSKQVRLRDISGLIVIDFIDMSEQRNCKALEQELKNAFSNDKAKVQISSMSNFGLIEMSRQRLKNTFLESHAQACTRCNGKGMIRSSHADALVVLRAIENEIATSDKKITKMDVYGHAATMMSILNNYRSDLATIETRYSTKINLTISHQEDVEGFCVEKFFESVKLDPVATTELQLASEPKPHTVSQTQPPAQQQKMFKKPTQRTRRKPAPKTSGSER